MQLSGSNAGFMGNPVVEGIYGSQGLLYASVYLIPLRIFMWSAGLSCFTVASPKDIVKKLVHHPCIIAVVIGMALMPFPDVVPSFLLQTMQSCSKCVLPVSMIVIGSILSEADIRKMLKGSTLFYCVVRLLGIPGCYHGRMPSSWNGGAGNRCMYHLSRNACRKYHSDPCGKI